MATSKKKSARPVIGFVGQGYIGKNYADNFEARGFRVERYSKEEPYIRNASLIRACDIVFIAVPTPTTPRGFDSSIVAEALTHIGPGKIAVIKSTVLPGTSRQLQKKFPRITILHSPEFLSKASARFDVDHPARNIIGVTTTGRAHQESAKRVMKVLPRAPFEIICGSNESEFIKYASNCFYYAKVVFINSLFDTGKKLKLDWGAVETSMANDPMIGKTHTQVVHKSGRGAGGICLIKDFAAFSRFVGTKSVPGGVIKLLKAIEAQNIKLLKDSHKDAKALSEVYGV